MSKELIKWSELSNNIFLSGGKITDVGSKINVLSLFDGISCGQVALERAGMDVKKYFKENNIVVNNITDLGSGDYSKTYKISTYKGDFALNIRDEMVGDYSALIDEYYDYLPTVYDVRKINGKYCVVMEVLLPISQEEKDTIDCIDYLFYANGEDGLDVWFEDNLRDDLYLKVEELIEETDIDGISEKQYTNKLKWFYEKYSDYETFINDIQSAFQEYNQALGFNYVDFHGDNLMQDKYGQVKLIDL